MNNVRRRGIGQGPIHDEELSFDCDGLSCGCFQNGGGCLLKLAKLAPTSHSQSTCADEFERLLAEGLKKLDEPVPEVVEPYHHFTHPDISVESRRRWLLASISVLVVLGTVTAFAIRQQWLDRMASKMVVSETVLVAHSTARQSTTAGLGEGEAKPLVAAGGFNELLLEAPVGRSEVSAEPAVQELSAAEAEKRAQNLMADVFSVGNPERQMGAVAGGPAQAESIRAVFGSPTAPGKLLSARLFQDVVRDIETERILPLVCVRLEGRDSDPVMTRLVPAEGGVWRVDWQMLRDSYVRELTRRGGSKDQDAGWVAVLARRSSGIAESADVRLRYLALDCLGDPSGASKVAVLVDKDSAFGRQLNSSMEFGSAYAGHALLQGREIGEQQRLVMKEFVGMRP